MARSLAADSAIKVLEADSQIASEVEAKKARQTQATIEEIKEIMLMQQQMIVNAAKAAAQAAEAASNAVLAIQLSRNAGHASGNVHLAKPEDDDLPPTQQEDFAMAAAPPLATRTINIDMNTDGSKVMKKSPKESNNSLRKPPRSMNS
jgi:hypothetical protein